MIHLITRSRAKLFGTLPVNFSSQLPRKRNFSKQREAMEVIENAENGRGFLRTPALERGRKTGFVSVFRYI